MKRNLFSRIVAGIGAFALVAGMMPAMTAQAAAGQPIYLVNGNTGGANPAQWGINSDAGFTLTVDGKELDGGNTNTVLSPTKSDGTLEDIILTVTLKDGYEAAGAPTINVYDENAVANPGVAPTWTAVTSAATPLSNGGTKGPWSYKIAVAKYSTKDCVYIAAKGATPINRVLFNGSKSGDDISILYNAKDVDSNLTPILAGGDLAATSKVWVETRTKYTGKGELTANTTGSEVDVDFARYTNTLITTVATPAGAKKDNGDPSDVEFSVGTYTAYRGGIAESMTDFDILVTSAEIENSARAIDKVVLEPVTNDADIKKAIKDGKDVPEPTFGDPVELEVSEAEGKVVNVKDGVLYTVKAGTLLNDAKITVTLKTAETIDITIEGDEGILFSTSEDAYIEAPTAFTVRKGGTLAEALINAFPNNPKNPTDYTIDGLFAMVDKAKNPGAESTPAVYDYVINANDSTYQIGEKEAVKHSDDAFLTVGANNTVYRIDDTVFTEPLAEDTKFYIALTFAKPKTITVTQDGQNPTDIRVTKEDDSIIKAAGEEYTNPADEFKFKVEATKKNVKVTKVSYAVGTKGAVEIKAGADGFYTIPANTIDANTVINVSTGMTKKVTVVEGKLQDESTDQYAVGEKVGIKATVPTGKTFDKWTSEQDVIFEDATAESTRFTMTDEDITVTATFKDAEKKNFVDVVAGSWYEAAVNWAVENGITEGVDATHFGVGQDLTRGQAAVFLAAYAKATLTEPTEKPFPDVELGQWYTKQMAWAKEKGVMSGYDNGNGGPNDPVTRIQAALMMRMLADPNGTGDKTFPDVTAAWMIPGAQWAGTNGIIKGDEAGNFNPNAVCKREQFVVMMKALNDKFPPKADENKADENKADENKADENKTDENKTDENKADENKADESKEGETTTP